MKTILILVLFLGDEQPVVDHIQMQDKQSCQLAGELIVKKYVETSGVFDWGVGKSSSYYICVNN